MLTTMARDVCSPPCSWVSEVKRSHRESGEQAEEFSNERAAVSRQYCAAWLRKGVLGVGVRVSAAGLQVSAPSRAEGWDLREENKALPR